MNAVSTVCIVKNNPTFVIVILLPLASLLKNNLPLEVNVRIVLESQPQSDIGVGSSLLFFNYWW